MSLKAIRIDSALPRFAIAAASILVLVAAAFAFTWGFANSAASGADLNEVAVLLVGMSPSDPQTHFTSAVLHEQTFEPADLDIALKEYETATALSPHNYLLWLELGTARGRIGDTAGAEAAFRTAHRLAPNYARVQWALGNFLLRQGAEDEAYAEIRKAVAAERSFAVSAAATALQVADGDVARVQTNLGDSRYVNAALALILAQQKSFDEAVAVWNSVSGIDGDDTLKETGQKLRRALIDAKRYRLAMLISRQPGEFRPSFEQVTNPGFEQAVKMQNAGEFEWQISAGNNPQIGVTDAHKHLGNLSLLAVFNAAESKDLRRVSQIVAVQPGRTYELELLYRADLRSKAAFRWEIVNAVDGKRFAVTEPVLHSAEWTPLRARFTVPADTDGVEIRLLRDDCVAANCFAAGNLWFDDFKLTVQ